MTIAVRCEADMKPKRDDLAIESMNCMQDGSVTLGGTLYGRVYSPPVPRAVSLGDSTFLEPSAASFDHFSTGVFQRYGWQQPTWLS